MSPLSLKQPTTLTLAHWHAIVQSASKIQIAIVIPFRMINKLLLIYGWSPAPFLLHLQENMFIYLKSKL